MCATPSSGPPTPATGSFLNVGSGVETSVGDRLYDPSPLCIGYPVNPDVRRPPSRATCLGRCSIRPGEAKELGGSAWTSLWTAR